MNLCVRSLLPAVGMILLTVSDGAAQDAASANAAAAFKFAEVEYLHRFTKDDLHEYTPDKQEDLKAYRDMVVVNGYPTVKDGDALADVANKVLGNYTAAKGIVARTNSVPRTDDKPAEHFVAVIFARPEFFEAAFARFRIHDGVGMSVVYSHRTYGAEASSEMQAWLEKNGTPTEAALMKWDVPKLPAAND